MVALVMLTNPDSGTNRRNGTASLQELAGRAGIPYREATTPETMASALQVFATLEPAARMLIICGGDGTIDAVIRLLRTQTPWEHEPALILLAGGTTNMTCRSFGIAGKPEHALKRLLTHRQTLPDHCQQADILRTENSDAPSRYGFFFGAIALPRLIRRTRQDLHSKGLRGRFSEQLVGLGLLGRWLLSTRGDGVLAAQEVTVEGGESGPVTMNLRCLTLSTLPRLLLGMRSTARPGVLHYAYIGEQGPFWRWLLAFWCGRSFHERSSYNGEATALTLRMQAEWTLDGELFATRKGEALHISLDKPVAMVTGI